MTRSMRCGCGFELHDDEATIEVFNEHVCTAEVERAPRWHESVFSVEGFFVLMALGLVIAVVVGTR
jgi:hypothetical protein